MNSLELLGSVVCETIAHNAVPWDFALSPRHRGWKRACAELDANCDTDCGSWHCMESTAAGHHFRQRACPENGGKNVWYTVAPMPDDFEPA